MDGPVCLFLYGRLRQILGGEQVMRGREEQEAAAFKRFFHGRIKAMSCMKKIKHVSLVLVIAAIVQAYFLVKRSMILDIEQ